MDRSGKGAGPGLNNSMSSQNREGTATENQYQNHISHPIHHGSHPIQEHFNNASRKEPRNIHIPIADGMLTASPPTLPPNKMKSQPDHRSSSFQEYQQRQQQQQQNATKSMLSTNYNPNMMLQKQIMLQQQQQQQTTHLLQRQQLMLEQQIQSSMMANNPGGVPPRYNALPPGAAAAAAPVIFNMRQPPTTTDPPMLPHQQLSGMNTMMPGVPLSQAGMMMMGQHQSLQSQVGVPTMMGGMGQLQSQVVPSQQQQLSPQRATFPVLRAVPTMPNTGAAAAQQPTQNSSSSSSQASVQVVPSSHVMGQQTQLSPQKPSQPRWQQLQGASVPTMPNTGATATTAATQPNQNPSTSPQDMQTLLQIQTLLQNPLIKPNLRLPEGWHTVWSSKHHRWYCFQAGTNATLWEPSSMMKLISMNNPAQNYEHLNLLDKSSQLSTAAATTQVDDGMTDADDATNTLNNMKRGDEVVMVGGNGATFTILDILRDGDKTSVKIVDCNSGNFATVDISALRPYMAAAASAATDAKIKAMAEGEQGNKEGVDVSSPPSSQNMGKAARIHYELQIKAMHSRGMPSPTSASAVSEKWKSPIEAEEYANARRRAMMDLEVQRTVQQEQELAQLTQHSVTTSPSTAVPSERPQYFHNSNTSQYGSAVDPRKVKDAMIQAQLREDLKIQLSQRQGTVQEQQLIQGALAQQVPLRLGTAQEEHMIQEALKLRAQNDIAAAMEFQARNGISATAASSYPQTNHQTRASLEQQVQAGIASAASAASLLMARNQHHQQRDAHSLASASRCAYSLASASCGSITGSLLSASELKSLENLSASELKSLENLFVGATTTPQGSVRPRVRGGGGGDSISIGNLSLPSMSVGTVSEFGDKTPLGSVARACRQSFTNSLQSQSMMSFGTISDFGVRSKSYQRNAEAFENSSMHSAEHLTEVARAKAYLNSQRSKSSSSAGSASSRGKDDHSRDNGPRSVSFKEDEESNSRLEAVAALAALCGGSSQGSSREGNSRHGDTHMADSNGQPPYLPPTITPRGKKKKRSLSSYYREMKSATRDDGMDVDE